MGIALAPDLEVSPESSVHSKPQARRVVNGVRAKAGQESWAYTVDKEPINQRYLGHP